MHIVKFPTVSLDHGNLIIDCPLYNDAQVLLQQFGSDLHLITQRLKIVETIQIRAGRETLYQPQLIGLTNWE